MVWVMVYQSEKWQVARGDQEVDLDGPLGDQDFLSLKDIKVFHDAFSLLKINFQRNSV